MKMVSRKRSEAIKKAWRRRKREGGKGICPICKKPVYAGGIRRKGKIYHKVCLKMRKVIKRLRG